MVTEISSNLFIPALLFLSLIYLIAKQLRTPFSSRSAPRLPPGPYAWPILGNALQMGRNPHVTLANLAKIYGPLFSVRLGSQLVVVASSQEAAAEILKTQDRVFSGRFVPDVIPAKWLGLENLSLGWNGEVNDEFKFLRANCQTILFSNKAILSQSCLREKKAMDMVRFIRTKEGENLRKKSKELYLRCSAMFEPIIKERRERKMVDEDDASSQQDFLDTLIRNGSTDEHINILLLELLVAGTDTSSSAIEWSIAELMKSPEYMKKAQEELKNEINQDVIQESDLPRLKFLHACLKESMRLHPPGPLLLPHRAIDSCQVMNYSIPKNSQVLVNAYAIGRDPKSWKDPLAYNPERFLISDMNFRGSNTEFIPFGAGRRACPGQPMATKHVPLLLASLLHFFDWSLPCGNDAKDIDMTGKFHTSLQKDQPLLLIPKMKI
ncbi:CYTOCHROME P450 FAMILY 76 SUBFAMILY C POLYPEPTIDE 5-RELATED [Salix viminalis]|uniref:CYTOCHROME P450 FAMILY 76 SUBFAMILY C POLYPEPTIDE 5-RELATED n=1 Tax=Salix viminalis TaxID=40686 RepID=A0A9Q0SGJ3_SALVM|nr:CYTOCHROME P450 FAMILY 76 SUBFAMILY C POLYPEPTIDE 5-RELATED [Salix viminalis]